MKRRQPGEDGMPGHVRTMDPARYRVYAEWRLAEHPGDTYGAAMAVWRAFCAERSAWLREHQVRRHVNGRDTLGTPRPPYGWVRETFDTPPTRWPS